MWLVTAKNEATLGKKSLKIEEKKGDKKVNEKRKGIKIMQL